jgi:hypothetical protein
VVIRSAERWIGQFALEVVVLQVLHHRTCNPTTTSMLPIK